MSDYDEQIAADREWYRGWRLVLAVIAVLYLVSPWAWRR